VGAEVFGVADPFADAEVIAVCADCLRAVGIGRFRIGIGDVRVTNGLLEQAGLGSEGVRRALEALQRRDMVLLEAVIADAGVSAAVRDWAMESLRPIPLPDAIEAGLFEDDAYSRIRGVVEQLRGFGMEQLTYIDMSIVRDMTYYTGMVFEVYGKGIGRAVGGGGRYDGLLERFGVSQPATGFALGVPEVAELIREQGGTAPRKPVTLVAAAPGATSQALAVTQSLRARGWRVRFDGDPVSREEAARRGADLYVTPKGCEEICGEPEGRGAAWAGWLAAGSDLAGIH
jgi:ATP phosphoribosyltransferase regulatory subunit